MHSFEWAPPVRCKRVERAQQRRLHLNYRGRIEVGLLDAERLEAVGRGHALCVRSLFLGIIKLYAIQQLFVNLTVGSDITNAVVDTILGRVLHLNPVGRLARLVVLLRLHIGPVNDAAAPQVIAVGRVLQVSQVICLETAAVVATI